MIEVETKECGKGAKNPENQGEKGNRKMWKNRKKSTEKEKTKKDTQVFFPHRVNCGENHRFELILIVISLIVWEKAGSMRIFFSTCSSEWSTVV